MQVLCVTDGSIDERQFYPTRAALKADWGASGVHPDEMKGLGVEQWSFSITGSPLEVACYLANVSKLSKKQLKQAGVSGFSKWVPLTTYLKSKAAPTPKPKMPKSKAKAKAKEFHSHFVPSWTHAALARVKAKGVSFTQAAEHYAKKYGYHVAESEAEIVDAMIQHAAQTKKSKAALKKKHAEERAALGWLIKVDEADIAEAENDGWTYKGPDHVGRDVFVRVAVHLTGAAKAAKKGEMLYGGTFYARRRLTKVKL
jgi:hypothetical protein